MLTKTLPNHSGKNPPVSPEKSGFLTRPTIYIYIGRIGSLIYPFPAAISGRVSEPQPQPNVIIRSVIQFSPHSLPNCGLMREECRTQKWAKRPLFYFLNVSRPNMAAVQNIQLLGRITDLCERSAVGTDIEIVDIQLRGAGNARLLRVYIDKPGGVTHSDCQVVSEGLGKLLDEDDPFPDGGYTLEVSSPGIERRLSKPRDFERVVGQKIRLAVQPPGETRRSLLEGRLAQCSGGALEVEVAPGNLVRVPLESVQKANLKFEW